MFTSSFLGQLFLPSVPLAPTAGRARVWGGLPGSSPSNGQVALFGLIPAQGHGRGGPGDTWLLEVTAAPGPGLSLTANLKCSSYQAGVGSPTAGWEIIKRSEMWALSVGPGEGTEEDGVARIHPVSSFPLMSKSLFLRYGHEQPSPDSSPVVAMECLQTGRCLPLQSRFSSCPTRLSSQQQRLTDSS